MREREREREREKRERERERERERDGDMCETQTLKENVPSILFAVKNT